MVNKRQEKTLARLFDDPVDGNIEWKKIESPLAAVGCRVIEGGKGVTFEKDGIRAYFHRPHPEKEALRYRVKAVRQFLVKIGVGP